MQLLLYFVCIKKSKEKRGRGDDFRVTAVSPLLCFENNYWLNRPYFWRDFWIRLVEFPFTMAPSSGHCWVLHPPTNAPATAESHRYLHTRIAQPGQVTSPQLLSSPLRQTDSSGPADTAHTHTVRTPKVRVGGRCSTADTHFLKGVGPVRAGDVPQVTSVLYLVVSDLLVFQPHDAVPELSLICRSCRSTAVIWSKFNLVYFEMRIKY